MFIYNVTIKVDWKIHEKWLEWMRKDQAPGILATGYFRQYQLVRLVEVEDADGPTYAVQYYADSIDDYKNYLNHSSAVINKEATRMWGDRFVMFETLMEVIN